MTTTDLHPQQGDLFGAHDPLDGPGQARHSDPTTSHTAAQLVRAKATTARVRLLTAHGAHPEGLTDEEAAQLAGLAPTSEYATRCSELMRMGVLADTTDTRPGATGVHRLVRVITPLGLQVLRDRDSA